MSGKINILYIDDEIINLQVFTAFFKTKFNIITALNTTMAREILKTGKIDLVISDQKMPGESGLSLLEDLKRNYPGLPRFMVTGFLNDIDINKGRESGIIQELFYKPINRDLLTVKINEYTLN